MSEWYPKYENEISDKLRGAKESDLRFFRIDEFLRSVKRVDEFSPTCRNCQSLKHEIENIKEILPEAVRSPGRERRQYDKLHTKLSKHMKKGHGFYPPYYFTYLYAVIWLVPLSTLSFLIGLLFPEITIWAFIAPGFAIGVVIGQIIGGKKDRKIRIEKKLL